MSQEISKNSSQFSYMESLYSSCEEITWRKVFAITLIAMLVLFPVTAYLSAPLYSSTAEEQLDSSPDPCSLSSRHYEPLNFQTQVKNIADTSLDSLVIRSSGNAFDHVKCSPQTLSCNKSDQSSNFNYPCLPGSHSVYSPIVGARVDELKGIKNLLVTNPLVKSFEKSLYQGKNLELIPIECRDVADKVGDEMLVEYLSPYESCGVTKENAIHWVDTYFRSGVTYINDADWGYDTWHVVVVVPKDEPRDKAYLPPSIVAIHEIMHTEETQLNEKPSFLKAGKEILTSLTTLIQLDTIFKKCKRLPLSDLIDYRDLENRKVIEVKKQSIPIGIVANCYRRLSKKFEGLYKAFISEESMHFLKTGECTVLTDQWSLSHTKDARV